MQLANFGAVLSFAIEFEHSLGDLYRGMMAGAPGSLSVLLQQLVDGCEKRKKLIERARREQIAEIILEPISGYASEDYVLPAAPAAGADEAAFQATIRQAEQVAASFFGLGAQKLSVPEVKRLLDRLAKEHARLAA
jgi:hypothetical protein